MQNSEHLNQYFSFRKQLDDLCQQLSALHSFHMNCRMGCGHCCMNFSIFPVEFYAIKMEAGEALKKAQRQIPADQCPFLVNNQCVIYASRPVICRTQGLPLLYMNNDGWELSACEKNFGSFDFDSFNSDNTFPQDRFNSKLFLINRSFIETLPGKSYAADDLIPLRRLGSN